MWVYHLQAIEPRHVTSHYNDVRRDLLSPSRRNSFFEGARLLQNLHHVNQHLVANFLLQVRRILLLATDSGHLLLGATRASSRRFGR